MSEPKAIASLSLREIDLIVEGQVPTCPELLRKLMKLRQHLIVQAAVCVPALKYDHAEYQP